MYDEGKILISQRAGHRKRYPLMWECNGGSILAGETSLEGVIREVKNIPLSLKNSFILRFVIIKREFNGKFFSTLCCIT